MFVHSEANLGLFELSLNLYIFFELIYAIPIFGTKYKDQR